jgi:hypothetical protein
MGGEAMQDIFEMATKTNAAVYHKFGIGSD